MGTVAQPAVAPKKRSLTRRVAKIIAVGIFTTLVIPYIVISMVAANILTTPRRAFGTETPSAYNLSYTDVSFPARGGDVQIAGWYIPQQAASRVVVMVHGKDGNRTNWLRDGYGDLIQALQARGFAVLMIDMRGHGRSGDAHYSFGVNEQRDIEGAVDWLKEQGFRPGSIGVYGMSMGAASSIIATAEEPAIGALVEDCGYAAIAPIIQKEWASASRLPDFFLPSTLLMGQLMFGYDIDSARPVDAIDDIAPRPVLIIHGTADKLVPVDNADQLKAAYPAAELWRVEGAKHGGSFNTNREAYIERVASFFDTHIK